MLIIKQIAVLPLFQGLPEAHLRELADIAGEMAFGRGQTIFSEGDDGTGFYVVVSGKVRVFKLSPDGKEEILHIFGPGELFGEAGRLSLVLQSTEPRRG